MNRLVQGMMGVFALIAMPQLAFSDGVTRGSAATEFGDTLPPIGFVGFCARYPRECKQSVVPAQMKSPQLEITPERLALIYQVNTFVNGKVLPGNDMELYGEEERWAYPTKAGDCEDYLLLKKKMLEQLGFHARHLRITVVLDEKNKGHAVLTVVTEGGDFVLDNLRNEILLWRDTNYTFLKRQAIDNPTHWVALTKVPPTVATAGN